MVLQVFQWLISVDNCIGAAFDSGSTEGPPHTQHRTAPVRKRSVWLRPLGYAKAAVLPLTNLTAMTKFHRNKLSLVDSLTVAVRWKRAFCILSLHCPRSFV